eukprot:CAMPEP_0169322354 /NCGR_PEP_ID=MMETSP1017-20121227/9378_1 /TAXON_ID=342587 /ORGANISM="Karlodinium micrum, Strain CCMP2283" /LENGTH=194 /DNA_ID=CAMNT_0009416897 /DNA_START=341 /DNA_END=928 /DNA_ORIENTATION=-
MLAAEDLRQLPPVAIFTRKSPSSAAAIALLNTDCPFGSCTSPTLARAASNSAAVLALPLTAARAKGAILPGLLQRLSQGVGSARASKSNRVRATDHDVLHIPKATGRQAADNLQPLAAPKIRHHKQRGQQKDNDRSFYRGPDVISAPAREECRQHERVAVEAGSARAFARRGITNFHEDGAILAGVAHISIAGW